MEKILINIDEKLKKEFSKNCKAFGVTMTTVIIGAIKEFNEKSKSKIK